MVTDMDDTKRRQLLSFWTSMSTVPAGASPLPIPGLMSKSLKEFIQYPALPSTLVQLQQNMGLADSSVHVAACAAMLSVCTIN